MKMKHIVSNSWPAKFQKNDQCELFQCNTVKILYKYHLLDPQYSKVVLIVRINYIQEGNVDPALKPYFYIFLLIFQHK